MTLLSIYLKTSVCLFGVGTSYTVCKYKMKLGDENHIDWAGHLGLPFMGIGSLPITWPCVLMWGAGQYLFKEPKWIEDVHDPEECYNKNRDTDAYRMAEMEAQRIDNENDLYRTAI
jgi:hypothetical protein